MDFETAGQTASRLNVNKRTVQLWAKDGRIPGACKVGRDWMIPTAFDGCQRGEKEKAEFTPMPFTSGSFQPGEARRYLEGFAEPTKRKVAEFEYYYFSGQAQKASQAAELYLRDEDAGVRLSACIVYGFANLTLGHINKARHGLNIGKEEVHAVMEKDKDPRHIAFYVFAAYMSSVLLHLPVSDLPSVKDYMRYLPVGLRLYSCYLLAHEAYIRGDYAYSLGIVETSLVSTEDIYPVSMIYLRLVGAMDLMNLKETEKAKEYFMEAWMMAYPDHFIEGFGEHHGLLQGLIETCLKETYAAHYKEIINITYQFSAGWRKVHNLDTREQVADNLTTTEFTIAMLANRRWSNQEIADYMGYSIYTIKKYLNTIYNKLGITTRKELKDYMLR